MQGDWNPHLQLDVVLRVAEHPPDTALIPELVAQLCEALFLFLQSRKRLMSDPSSLKLQQFWLHCVQYKFRLATVVTAGYLGRQPNVSQG